jgi:hypothetical protein
VYYLVVVEALSRLFYKHVQREKSSVKDLSFPVQQYTFLKRNRKEVTNSQLKKDDDIVIMNTRSETSFLKKKKQENCGVSYSSLVPFMLR